MRVGDAMAALGHFQALGGAAGLKQARSARQIRLCELLGYLISALPAASPSRRSTTSRCARSLAAGSCFSDMLRETAPFSLSGRAARSLRVRYERDGASNSSSATAFRPSPWPRRR
jgi:hypothetical protein